MALSYNMENEINSYWNLLKNNNIDNIDNKLYKYSDVIFYMDIISECEKLDDYVLNVVQAIVEKKLWCDEHKEALKRVFLLKVNRLIWLCKFFFKAEK